jgi:hypothetical protein
MQQEEESMSSVAQLHTRLLRLPRDDQQALIKELPAWRRAELAKYIQAQQRQIEAGDEPELEPRPAASLPSTSGMSSPDTRPSSPASSSGLNCNLGEDDGSMQELFARARRMREELNMLQEMQSLYQDSLNIAHGEIDDMCYNLSMDDLPGSDSSLCLESDLDDLDDEASEDSTLRRFPRSSDITLRALLRYLADLSAEKRQDAIKSLTRERRVDLFAFMLTPEGRRVCDGAFEEDELLGPHLDDLKASLSSSDSEDSDSDVDSAGMYSFSPPDRTGLGQTNFERSCPPANLRPLDSTERSLLTDEGIHMPSTPSKQQLVSRPRNTRPLGALQVEPLASRSPAQAKAAGTPGESSHSKLQLEPSGINGSALRDWLCGRASGPLCLTRLLEGMQWARFSGQRDAKRLSSTEDLYSTSVATGYGGSLGGMVGGVARAFTADAESHLGGLFSSLDGPQRGLKEADAWVRRYVEEAAPESSSSPPRRHLEGLDEEDINLTFRRRCVALHPHRSGGDLEDYTKVHVYMEILRQWQEVTANPLLLAEKGHNHTGPGMSDKEICEALSKERAKVVEESKAASTEELKLLDDKLSSRPTAQLDEGEARG